MMMMVNSEVIQRLCDMLREHGFVCTMRHKRANRGMGAETWYELVLSYKEGIAWWQFTAVIPHDPHQLKLTGGIYYEMYELTVKGCVHNPGYTHDISGQRRRKESIKEVVVEMLTRIMREAGL